MLSSTVDFDRIHQETDAKFPTGCQEEFLPFIIDIFHPKQNINTKQITLSRGHVISCQDYSMQCLLFHLLSRSESTLQPHDEIDDTGHLRCLVFGKEVPRHSQLLRKRVRCAFHDAVGTPAFVVGSNHHKKHRYTYV